MTGYLYTTFLTVPALTPIATPVVKAVQLDDRKLATVRVIIPPGHAALTGLAVTWGGTQIIPYLPGTWLTGDDEVIDFAYEGEVTAGGLVLAGYNLDMFDHTFYQRWSVTDLAGSSPVVIASPQSAAAVQPADLAAITGLAGLVTA